MNKEIKQFLLIISKLAKMTDAKMVVRRRQTVSLILIVSVYTDFSPLELGKIQIFFLKIWQNTDFFREYVNVFYIFSLPLQIFPLEY